MNVWGRSASLLPKDLTQRITRQLLEDKIPSAAATFVPNWITVWLHQSDHAALEGALPSVCDDLLDYLTDWVAEQRLTLTGPLHVHFRPSPSLRKGQVEIVASRVPAETVSEILSGQATDPLVTHCTERPEPLARLSLLNGEHAGREWEVWHPITVIGRSEVAHVMLADTKVSRVHARLSQEEDGWWLEDIHSRNGTEVNGERLTPGIPRHVHDGDEILIGGLCFRWRLARAATTPQRNAA